MYIKWPLPPAVMAQVRSRVQLPNQHMLKYAGLGLKDVGNFFLVILRNVIPPCSSWPGTSLCERLWAILSNVVCPSPAHLDASANSALHHCQWKNLISSLWLEKVCKFEVHDCSCMYNNADKPQFCVASEHSCKIAASSLGIRTSMCILGMPNMCQDSLCMSSSIQPIMQPIITKNILPSPARANAAPFRVEPLQRNWVAHNYHCLWVGLLETESKSFANLFVCVFFVFYWEAKCLHI